MRLRIALMLSISTVVALLTACEPGAPVSDPSGAQAPRPGASGLTGLDGIAETIRLIGEGMFDDSYAGVEVDADARVVHVWRKASPTFDAHILSVVQPERIRIHAANHSAKDLRAFIGTIMSDSAYWESRRLPLYQVGGPWHRGECIQIVTADQKRAERELSERYPTAPLCFSTGSPIERSPLFN